MIEKVNIKKANPTNKTQIPPIGTSSYVLDFIIKPAAHTPSEIIGIKSDSQLSILKTKLTKTTNPSFSTI
jgi:hypothetical protein